MLHGSVLMLLEVSLRPDTGSNRKPVTHPMLAANIREGRGQTWARMGFPELFKSRVQLLSFTGFFFFSSLTFNEGDRDKKQRPFFYNKPVMQHVSVSTTLEVSVPGTKGGGGSSV